MRQDAYKKIIDNYIKAYNEFDIESMMRDMHDDVLFENISNGEVTLITHGIAELRSQAEQAIEYLREREQKITSITFGSDEVEVDIDYTGVLAIDLPDGSKAGNKIELHGKSISKFKDGKIIELHDIS